MKQKGERSAPRYRFRVPLTVAFVHSHDRHLVYGSGVLLHSSRGTTTMLGLPGASDRVWCVCQGVAPLPPLLPVVGPQDDIIRAGSRGQNYDRACRRSNRFDIHIVVLPPQFPRLGVICAQKS